LRPRVLDHGAVAAAARARLRQAEEPLALDLDAAPVALGTDRWRRPGLRARPAALTTGGVDLDRDLRLDATQGVLERQVDDGLEVRAAHSALLADAGAAAPATSEEAAEDVPEVTDVEVAREVVVAAAEAARAVRAEGVELL